jgi:predicted N-acetyltransferase YhbS
MNLVLRSPSRDDAAPAGHICYRAFKTIAEHHAFPADFPAPEAAAEFFAHMLSRPDVHGVVAERDGRVVGSNFLWAGDPVAGVGPITVEPAEQNAAVGRRLMEAVLSRAGQNGISAVRLVQAAYHTRSLSLYTKLGFVSREPLVAMQGPAPGVTIAGHTVRPAVDADQPAIDELCRGVHGHTRSREVAHAISEGSARVVEHEGAIAGYTTGVGFFGHSVGRSADAVTALIAAAPVFTGPGFLLPIRQAALFRWCLEHGLKVVQPMTLMSMGPYSEPQGVFLPSVLY